MDVKVIVVEMDVLDVDELDVDARDVDVLDDGASCMHRGVASATSSMRNACYCCFGVSAGPWCFSELNRTAKSHHQH